MKNLFKAIIEQELGLLKRYRVNYKYVFYKTEKQRQKAIDKYSNEWRKGDFVNRMFVVKEDFFKRKMFFSTVGGGIKCPLVSRYQDKFPVLGDNGSYVIVPSIRCLKCEYMVRSGRSKCCSLRRKANEGLLKKMWDKATKDVDKIMGNVK